jgi:hypothetical protein
MRFDFKGERFYNPFMEIKKVLAYVYMIENHWDLIGIGTINRDKVIHGLKECNYKSPLMLESFTPFNPDINTAMQNSLTHKYIPDVFAQKVFELFRSKVAKYNLWKPYLLSKAEISFR